MASFLPGLCAHWGADNSRRQERRGELGTAQVTEPKVIRPLTKVRDQGLWEARGGLLVNTVQGRMGPVGFLEEVCPHGYLDEKQESVW